MKTQRMGIAVLGMVLLASTYGWAQDSSQPSPYLVLSEDSMNPGDSERYFNAIGKIFGLIKENQLPVTCHTYVGESSGVLYISPIDNYTEIDTWPVLIQKLDESADPGELSKVTQEYTETVASSSRIIAKYRPELSYTPKSPAFVFDPQSPCFCSITYYYMKPGSETKTAEIHRQALRMLEEKQSNLPMIFYQTTFGPDLPCLITLFHARDPEQFQTLLQERGRLMGDEFIDLYNQVTPYIRRFETKNYTYDPARSCIPRNEAEKTEPKPDNP